MVSDIHRTIVKGREGADDQRRLVSDIRTMPTTKYVLIVAQDQTRSATSTTDGTSILYLRVVSPANHPHRHRGLVSDVMS